MFLNNPCNKLDLWKELPNSSQFLRLFWRNPAKCVGLYFIEFLVPYSEQSLSISFLWRPHAWHYEDETDAATYRIM
jgi:hypothetical protein